MTNESVKGKLKDYLIKMELEIILSQKKLAYRVQVSVYF